MRRVRVWLAGKLVESAKLLIGGEFETFGSEVEGEDTETEVVTAAVLTPKALEMLIEGEELAAATIAKKAEDKPKPEAARPGSLQARIEAARRNT